MHSIPLAPHWTVAILSLVATGRLGAPRPASGWAGHRTAVGGLCQTGADRNAVTVLLQKLCLSLLAATTRA